MVVEIAGGRAIAPYLGSTIYTWASVIGFVLGALSAGYYVGGKLADRYKDRRHLSYVFVAAAFCTLIIPVLIAIIVPYSVPFDLAVASIITSFALVPASIFYGMVGPYAIKLITKKGQEGRVSGRVFAISTVGSIIGVLGTGFMLIPNIAISYTFILAALSMFLCSLIIGYDAKIPDLFVFAVFIVFVSTISFSPPVCGEIIYSTSSEYYEINILKTSLEGVQSLVLFLDSSPSSAIAVDGSLPFGYVKKSRLGYELTDNPERALVIGVAAGTQVEDLKGHFPNLRVDGVEIDEKTVGLGERYFGLEIDNRTEITIDDARRYVKSTSRSYDIVLMDVFRGSSIPYHLASVEFVRELKAIMEPEGVFIINIISPVEGEQATLLSLIHNTLSQEFSNVIVLPVGDDPYKTQNCIIIASDMDLSSFSEKYSDEIYPFKPATDRIITDDLNPADVHVPTRR